MSNITTISLEILLLNDLYNHHVIDEEIYKAALTKLTALTESNETDVSSSSEKTPDHFERNTKYD